MPKKKMTRRNAVKVVEAVLKLDKELAQEIMSVWNDALDVLAAQDAFGTEGQNDPRGDNRD